MSILAKPYFFDEGKAVSFLEAVLWPDGPVCPHCGTVDRIYVLDGVKDKKGRVRHGLKKCGGCRAQFTVRVGTIFESSHIPLHKWLQAAFLMAGSKKGISSHQLHRTLEVTYKSAWFMSHRLREAMRDGVLAPLGGSGKIVEADETFIGKRKGVKMKRGGFGHKFRVLSLVERGGDIRSVHLDKVSKREIEDLIAFNVGRESRLMTDTAVHYKKRGYPVASHEMVDHSKGEYVRDDIHVNTLEGYFALFKRGMKGIYQHCAEKHLHRYLAEFDFRYNQRHILDSERAARVLVGARGKRLKFADSSARVAR